MDLLLRAARRLLATALFSAAAHMQAADSLRVATYNVENYLDAPAGNRPLKSDAAKAAVRHAIRELHPDVLALEEMGSTNALMELQASLKSEGVDLPHWDCVTGADTNIHVAILSRLPITARRAFTNDYFLLAGRRHRVARGFDEIEVQVNGRMPLTLIAAHLKSRLPVPEADEADLRLEEARLLREKIDALLTAKPNAALIVLGDFNDLHDSPPIKTLVGHGNRSLIDTRPVERHGNSPPPTETAPATYRAITWTHFYAKEDTYSRMDYILISHALAGALDAGETYVLDLPDWGIASDHRPVLATFRFGDK